MSLPFESRKLSGEVRVRVQLVRRTGAKARRDSTDEECPQLEACGLQPET